MIGIMEEKRKKKIDERFECIKQLCRKYRIPREIGMLSLYNISFIIFFKKKLVLVEKKLTMSTSKRTFPFDKAAMMYCFLRANRPWTVSGQPNEQNKIKK